VRNFREGSSVWIVAVFGESFWRKTRLENEGILCVF